MAGSRAARLKPPSPSDRPAFSLRGDRALPRRSKRSTDAPTSIRLPVDLKQALRDEGKRDQHEHGGPPRSLHYVIVTVLKEWVERKREQREALERL